MRRFFLGIAILAALLWSGQIDVAHAAGQAAKAPGTHSKQAPANPADFVGPEPCETCHAEVAKKFSTSPHSKLALQHSGAGTTCESCHGPGKAHVESGGDKAKIFSPSSATAKEVDETCLGCHQGKHANFERSAHGEGKVSCVSCHSVHDSEDK